MNEMETIGLGFSETTPSIRARAVEMAIAKYNQLSGLTLELNSIPDSTLEKARGDERSGSWEKAASHYLSVWEDSSFEPPLRGEAIVGLAQIFINRGELGRARNFLSELEAEIPNFLLEERSNKYLRARINEKLGWIADYEGEYGVARKKFLLARQLVKDPQTEDEKSLFSTTTHFLGRASVGLALGIRDNREKESLLKDALSFFQKDLEDQLDFREMGTPHLDNEAFQYLWMARCYIHLGDNTNKADECIAKAEILIRESVAKDPNSEGMLGHLNNIKGAYWIALKNPEQAFAHFQEALRVRLELSQKEGKSRFRKGEAESLLGMAISKFGLRRFGEAYVYFQEAVKTYPMLVLRGTI